MAYAGGFVTFGQGTGIVIATGNATETGRISPHSALQLEVQIDYSQDKSEKSG